MNLHCSGQNRLLKPIRIRVRQKGCRSVIVGHGIGLIMLFEARIMIDSKCLTPVPRQCSDIASEVEAVMVISFCLRTRNDYILLLIPSTWAEMC